MARQAKAISDKLTLEHEIVCVTDHPPGSFPSHIRIVPVWDDWKELGGCYRRLKAFAPEMRDVLGPRFAWIDLDCAVVGLSLIHI